MHMEWYCHDNYARCSGQVSSVSAPPCPVIKASVSCRQPPSQILWWSKSNSIFYGFISEENQSVCVHVCKDRRCCQLCIIFYCCSLSVSCREGEWHNCLLLFFSLVSIWLHKCLAQRVQTTWMVSSSVLIIILKRSSDVCKHKKHCSWIRLTWNRG